MDATDCMTALIVLVVMAFLVVPGCMLIPAWLRERWAVAVTGHRADTSKAELIPAPEPVTIVEVAREEEQKAKRQRAAEKAAATRAAKKQKEAQELAQRLEELELAEIQKWAREAELKEKRSQAGKKAAATRAAKKKAPRLVAV